MMFVKFRFVLFIWHIMTDFMSCQDLFVDTVLIIFWYFDRNDVSVSFTTMFIICFFITWPIISQTWNFEKFLYSIIFDSRYKNPKTQHTNLEISTLTIAIQKNLKKRLSEFFLKIIISFKFLIPVRYSEVSFGTVCWNPIHPSHKHLIREARNTHGAKRFSTSLRCPI